MPSVDSIKINMLKQNIYSFTKKVFVLSWMCTSFIFSTTTTANEEFLKPLESMGLTPLYKIEVERSRVKSLVFSPDGKTLVSGHSEIRVDTPNRVTYPGRINLWSASNLNHITELPGHESSVLAAKFTPDGRYLISVSESGSIKKWEIINKKESARFKPHNSAFYYDLAVSNDNRWILIGGSGEIHESFVFSLFFICT